MKLSSNREHDACQKKRCSENRSFMRRAACKAALIAPQRFTRAPVLCLRSLLISDERLRQPLQQTLIPCE
jgi:hypothetical protein